MWPWLVGGAAGILLTVLTMVGLWMSTEPESPIKSYIVIFAVKMPVSMVIFVIAMFISSAMGSFDFGELHVTAVKALFLLVMINLVSMVPFGNWLALVVWVAGLMVLFHLDMWEARFMFIINWILACGNFGGRMRGDRGGGESTSGRGRPCYAESRLSSLASAGGRLLRLMGFEPVFVQKIQSRT